MFYQSLTRRGLLLAGMLALTAGARAAAEPGRVELGFVPFSVSRFSAGGESVTSVQIPASGSFLVTGERGIYLQWFVSEHLALEPQLSYAGFFQEDDDFNTLIATLRLNYLLSGPDRPSLYLYGGGGLFYASFGDEDSETNPQAGGGLGFRWPIRSAGSVRLEAGYERLFSDDDADVFKLSVGVALRF
jgi:hypothetical protein